MVEVLKKATEDGAFDVCIGHRVIASGLTSFAADILIKRLICH
jgi:hypothetical protein